MERSLVRSLEIKALLKEALTDKINDRAVYMKGIDASYRYEGYSTYMINELLGEIACRNFYGKGSLMQ